jgi:chromosome segregation ATPase
MAKFPSSAKRSLLVLLVLSGALAGLRAAPNSSFSKPDSETAELRSALGALAEENDRLTDEKDELTEKLALAEATAKRLTESVAVANEEAEVFRRQTGELKLKLEALGLSGGSGNTSKLEQRLLAAVNNLRHAEDDRKKLTEALVILTEASMNSLKNGLSPEAKAALERAVKDANKQLGTASGNAVEASAEPATLTDGRIISLKDDLSLVVANVGTKQGVAVGMPFQVLRENRVIGTVRVVDARERISGALIQNLNSEKEKFRVGDRLKIAARQ